MGILDLFRRAPTPERFARLFEQRARAQGFDKPMAYDPAAFRMVIGDGGNLFNLTNAFHDYCAAPRALRETVLLRYLAGLDMPPLASTFAEAKAHLMPAVRSRAYFEFLRLSKLIEDGGERGAGPALALGDDAIILLAYDTEHALSVLDQSHLDDWGVTPEAALEAALANLRDRSGDRLVDLGDGVLAGDWGDAYDSARIMLPDLAYRAVRGGEPLMMIPTRGCFLLTSSNCSGGQMAMIGHAHASMREHGRVVSAAMYAVRDGRVVQHVPDDSAVALALHELRAVNLADDYASQKDLLEALHEKTGADVFVATVDIVSNKATGRIRSYCTWAEGVVTLLPKTDLVAMGARDAAGNVGTAKFLAWDDAVRIGGDLMQEAEGYPVRYLVKAFPSAQALEGAPAATL